MLRGPYSTFLWANLVHLHIACYLSSEDNQSISKNRYQVSLNAAFLQTNCTKINWGEPGRKYHTEKIT